MNNVVILEAERQLLNILMNYPESIPKVIDKLKQEYFISTANGIIFSTIKDLYEEHKPVMSTSVSERLSTQKKLNQAGGVEYICDLTTTYTQETLVEEVASIIYSNAKKRESIKMSGDFVEEMKASQDIEKTFFDFQNRINGINFDYNENSTMSVYDVAKQVEQQAYFIKDNPNLNPGISTGFKNLDKITGLLETQQLIFIGARPSQGKTAFALQLATKIATGFRVKGSNDSVCLFSLEMKKESIVRRMIASLGMLETWKLKSTETFTKEDIKRLTTANKRLNGLKNNLYIEDQSGITLNGIRNKLIKMKREHNTKVAIVDYLQIIGRTGNSDDETQAISQLCEGLKQIGRDLDIVIICLAQLNRGVESRTDKRPMLSDIKGSGTAEAAADIVMLLYRDDYYKPANERNPISEMEVIVAKNRDGKTGVAKFDFWLEYSIFVEKEQYGEGTNVIQKPMSTNN